MIHVISDIKQVLSELGCGFFLFEQVTVKRMVNSGELDFLHDAIYKALLKISK